MAKPKSPKPGKPTKRAAAPAPAGPTPVQTASPFALSNEEIERALAAGDRDGELEDLFGPAQFQELKRLHRQVQSRSVRGGDRVLILPGIMGSKIGYDNFIDHTIWLNPIALVTGELFKLKLPPNGKPCTELGVILFVYLKLKLKLQLSGFDADFHPYDWRQSVGALGRQFAKVLTKERAAKPNGKLYVVAHSMGGLVVRASLPHLKTAQVRQPDRVVMLGTPNRGSFAPVQAFRGVGGAVQKVAALNSAYTPAALADVFGTFPGLMEMIPSTQPYPANFFDLASWPANGGRPTQAALDAARKVQDGLSEDIDALIMVAGVGKETITNAVIDPETKEFRFEQTREGDGTVPLVCARIATAKKTYFINSEHGGMPGDDRIIEVLPDLFVKGETSRLNTEHRVDQRVAPQFLTEEAVRLRNMPAPGLPSQQDQRLIASDFIRPPAAEFAVDAPTAPPVQAPADYSYSGRILVGRSRARRLEITLAKGDITRCEAACYVVGLFKNVAPGGAARAVDSAIGGAMSTLIERRMFGANVGEVSLLPRGRHLLRAEAVAFAGLGAYDQFDESVLEGVASNLVRTFAAARIDDFAMVPMSASSGQLTVAAVRYLMKGVVQGLKEADPDRRIRGLTICETDGERYEAIRSELFRLTPTALFDDVELELREQTLPEPSPTADLARAAPQTPKTYLTVRHSMDREGVSGLTASVLTSGSGAAIEAGYKPVGEDGGPLATQLARLETQLDTGRLEAFGKSLGEIVLSDNVRAVLSRHIDSHLVIVHDAAASKVPWETLKLETGFPVLKGGVSHRYEAADFSIAKWRDDRRQARGLNMLLVVNPTGDLDGAEKEGQRIADIAGRLGPALQLKVLNGAEARKEALLDCFSSGEFDVVHYAGHAYFDAQVPSQSGILCADREVLSGADLARLTQLPALMVFNACESARVRKDPGAGADRVRVEEVRRHVSFAEALLRGGVGNYIGTYWPVGDAAAEQFAGAFYEAVLGSKSLNAALLEGRTAIVGGPDWSNYIFYGDPDFRVKL